LKSLIYSVLNSRYDRSLLIHINSGKPGKSKIFVTPPYHVKLNFLKI